MGPDNNCLKEAKVFFDGVDIGNVSAEIEPEFNNPIEEFSLNKASCSGSFKISQYKIGQIRKDIKCLLTAQRLIPVYNRTKNKRIKRKQWANIKSVKGLIWKRKVPFQQSIRRDEKKA